MQIGPSCYGPSMPLSRLEEGLFVCFPKNITKLETANLVSRNDAATQRKSLNKIFIQGFKTLRRCVAA
jgi:hypothetical protein